MFGIRAQDIQGQTVRPAPIGIEGDDNPRLVWEDPNPSAMIRFCQVEVDGKLITAPTLLGLKVAAELAGLVCNDDLYIP